MSTLAVITGTSRGIGAGIADAASASGAFVAACNRTPTGVEQELVADLSEPESWAGFSSWYDGLLEANQPDRVVVVHNSATLTPIGFAGQVDTDAYRRLVLLDSAAPQMLGHSVIEAAGRRDMPTVLFQLSSGAAVTAFPGWSGYCAAKAGVEMWVGCVAQELAAEGAPPVRVAAIRPGVVATDMQAEIRGSETTEFPDVERFRGMHAGGALADPAVIGARIWAAAEDSSWSNGATIDVAGPA